ncbi:hypothetical protein U2F26_32455 [Micromonospora sp. 4G57]|uniref:DUF3533 domain-containing protein n=1 Tax=Micromonospora sicca TaxID=2202420 RepID=A0ABU5JN67_9ACTN|nr:MULTISPECIES: hypothetical protein [unclassified Micromonospora]MDZ5447365.1 hypothetical protein [Micromonospora sp. 4G57]MDZ5494070.1 hypothetical protein [Micromonospora sp. 4G53]
MIFKPDAVAFFWLDIQTTLVEEALMSSPDPSPTRPRTTEHAAWLALVITGLIIGGAFIAVYVGLQRDPTPQHLPIAVVGSQLATAAQSGLGDSVEVTEVASIQDGAAITRDGDAIGVLGATSPTTLRFEYAGASGFSESGAARKLVSGLAAHAGFTVQETDIAPLADYDSRGLSAFYVVFGVTLSSFVLAQGLTGAAAKVRLRHRLYAMAGFAVAIGLGAAAIAGPIYGSLTAPFPLLALSLTLLSLASAFSTKALGAWLGPAGIGLAVLILTTVGNATSGATIGYDLLPRWAQAVSAILPPGAAVRAVNKYGYFDGSHAAWSLVVLAVWFLAGLGLVLLRQRLTERRTTTGALGPNLVQPELTTQEA